MTTKYKQLSPYEQRCDFSRWLTHRQDEAVKGISTVRADSLLNSTHASAHESQTVPRLVARTLEAINEQAMADTSDPFIGQRVKTHIHCGAASPYDYTCEFAVERRETQKTLDGRILTYNVEAPRRRTVL